MNTDDRISVLEHIGKIIELRFASTESAMQLYREDMKGRLQALNDLRAEVTRDRDLLLPRETFDLWVRERRGWHDTVNERLTKIETRALTWTASLALFFTILTLALAWWRGTCQ